MMESKAKELLDMIEKRNKDNNRIKNESRTTEVGIFWLINNELYFDGTPIREAESYGDFLVHTEDHFNYWEDHLSSKNSPIYLLAKNKDYDYYPRGRVVYSIKDDKYYVYVDKCIKEDKIKEIVKLMHFPKDKVKILNDHHYQCSVCNKNYIQ